MKRIIYLLAFTCLTVSCVQVKDIAYFQQTDRNQTVLNTEMYDARIKPKDILSIAVVSSEPDASRRYYAAGGCIHEFHPGPAHITEFFGG